MENNHYNSYCEGKRFAVIGILSNAFLFVIKILAGIFGRSQAMIADAFHTASDILTSIGVLIGFKIAQQPPDDHHPFGHGRAESIVAKLISIFLIFVGFFLAFHSARKLLSSDIAEPGVIALLAAVLSIVVKQITYKLVISASKRINSVSLKVDAYHHRSDVLSSVAALIGIAGARMGYTFMDPLAGIIVSGFIIKMGVESFHEAYDELMDAAPPQEIYEKITNIVCQVEGVEEVKKTMVRKTGIEFYLEITVGVDSTKKVSEAHEITVDIQKHLVKSMSNIQDVIVHVEPCGKCD